MFVERYGHPRRSFNHRIPDMTYACLLDPANNDGGVQVLDPLCTTSIGLDRDELLMMLSLNAICPDTSFGLIFLAGISSVELFATSAMRQMQQLKNQR